jgi:predicted  nucleic acid-binding Zn-ribbon protein
MTEKLPSIDDFYEELPSVDELITEEKLPSVDEFIEPPRPEEEIADAIRQGDEEKPVDTGPCSIEEQYTEFVRLVNDVREDIPEIPEIKYYDEQISELSTTIEEVRESIPEVPEQKTYDEEIEAICGLIDELKEEVRTNAAEIPEIRYYDDQIERLETSLKSLPEIRHYEGDLTSIRDEIVLIKESIPVFPKWVNEVNEVPDFSWIGKQFSVIDDDFIKVADNANSIRDRITEEVRQLSEDLETKRFESKTEIKELTQNFTEVKEKIYEELRTAAVGILDIKHAFKNDDRLMKKQIMSKYNLLKLNVEEQIEKFNKTNEDTKDLYAGYFESLTEEISNLPKVKYYEEDIKNVREEFNKGLDSLKILVEDIRQKQKLAKDEIETIQEGLLNEPPENTQSVGTGDDPLAPLDKQFPNLKALADHYRLFINRTQQQLAVIGGGGAGFVPDLADVDFDIATGTDKILVYNADRNGTKFVGIGSTSLINVVTGNLEVTGNISCAGTVTYDDVTFVDSIGVVTARTGIELGAGSITPVISFEAATETTTTTSASTIDTFAAATYRSAQYQIQITQGSNYHVTTLNVLHDGSQVYIMEFGTVRTGVALATFDADISSGNVRVRGTPTTSLSTVFKLSKVLTRV